MARAVGNMGGIPKSTERSTGATKPTTRPQGQPQTKPHSSVGMCMGESMLPICGICPVRKGSTRARARKSAVYVSLRICPPDTAADCDI